MILNSINVNGRVISVGYPQNADFNSILDALNSNGIKARKGDNFTIVLEPIAGNVVISGNSPYWGIEKREDFEFD